MTRSLILGTAGHIDHGKTELVKALTGVDTDRLQEEKARGITIDLGFAELRRGDVQLGVVDVPGHEGFVRNMLAGATGMDVVLLVVAADEGVMPQTREHLAILDLLGVRRLVVALTKADLVQDEWLELARDEVAELLAAHGLAGAPIVATSTRTGRGLEELTTTLVATASGGEPDDESDLARLPVDRAFTVRGTGTVVTGTLWSGTLRAGERVRLLPGGLEARIRGLQVHGREVTTASAGQRAAVALSGAGVDLDTVTRGLTLVTDDAWEETSMLTVRVGLIPDTAWTLDPGQRVRVHLGTAEIMARLVLLGREEPLGPGEEAWAQLRLETPGLARVGERIVLRSYSPVTTIGGATVVEAPAPKRASLDADDGRRLERILDGAPGRAVAAVLDGVGRVGIPVGRLPLATGLGPSAVEAALQELGDSVVEIQDTVVHASVARAVADILLGAVDRHHRDQPLVPGPPVEALRSVIPPDAARGLADAVLAELVEEGELTASGARVARPGFRPRLTDEQKGVRDELLAVYRAAGLSPPSVDELPDRLVGRADLWPILRLLEDEGVLVALDHGLFIDRDSLQGAVAAVASSLAGRSGLGPADFKEILPVSRKYLLPILAHLDRVGVTLRSGQGRDVAAASGEAGAPGSAT